LAPPGLREPHKVNQRFTLEALVIHLTYVKLTGFSLLKKRKLRGKLPIWAYNPNWLPVFLYIFFLIFHENAEIPLRCAL
jgi:hypothetical protein